VNIQTSSGGCALVVCADAPARPERIAPSVMCHADDMPAMAERGPARRKVGQLLDHSSSERKAKVVRD